MMLLRIARSALARLAARLRSALALAAARRLPAPPAAADDRTVVATSTASRSPRPTCDSPQTDLDPQLAQLPPDQQQRGRAFRADRRSSCWPPRREARARQAAGFPAPHGVPAASARCTTHISRSRSSTRSPTHEVKARYDKEIADAAAGRRSACPPHPGEDRGRSARRSSSSSTRGERFRRSSPRRSRPIRAARPTAAISAISARARWCRNSRRRPSR